MLKQVVVLGGFGHEGITTNANALGYEILPLSLDGVKPKTWLKRSISIGELFKKGNLAATIIYMHTSLLLKASQDEYKSSFFQILEQAKKSKAIIFIFQDNLDGIFSIKHWQTKKLMSIEELEIETKLNDSFKLECALERARDYEKRKNEINAFIETIYEAGIEVAPFFARSDVTIRLQEFLNDIEEGVFLRLFVRNDRLQAEQLKSLLSVLERYLRQVEGQNFSIDSRKSDKGIVYLLRSESGMDNFQSLNDALSRFDIFMNMCGDYPEQAIQILLKQGFNDYDSSYLIEQYSTDYKRILLDSRHEFERKSLLLKHRFENDMLDQSGKQSIFLKEEGISGLLSSIATGKNIVINIDNKSIINSQNSHNEIGKLINETNVYNENDEQLIGLFSKYADGIESLQCRSDLDQLKDDTVAEPARRNAKQRLLGFLRKAAHKTVDVAEKITVEVLSKYLESMLKGGV